MSRKPRRPLEPIEVARAKLGADLTDYIARIVDAAPPLTESQRARLAALLYPRTTKAERDEP